MKDKIVNRWAITGLLSGVDPKHWKYVASRLQLAAQNQIITKEQDLVEREIVCLREEGYFGYKSNE